MTSAQAAEDVVVDRPQKSATSLAWWRRLIVAGRLFVGLRLHDFRAARAFMLLKFPGSSLPLRMLRFGRWVMRESLVTIPDAVRGVVWTQELSRQPVWLADGNPLANHPWQTDPLAVLPDEVDTLVIGAGFTGASLAYHWSKHAPQERTLAVVEMDDPACGASGRNAGTVVMGRYAAMVHSTLTKHWAKTRPKLSESQRDQLARQFATVYARAAYKNADLVEETIRREGFDCDYVRSGWVQLRTASEQSWLDRSVEMAAETGCTDWSSLPPHEVAARCGAATDYRAGFSRAAATFHPARWVWCLLQVALRSRNVRLFTRTKVLGVEDCGDFYAVRTSRGVIRARHVVNATESYTALLHRHLHNFIAPVQSQAAFGIGGPRELRSGVSVSSNVAFFERREKGLLFGSDETPLPDRQAGRNRPSRFISAFVLGEMRRYFPAFDLRVTHEWSGTAGFTPDQYPVVGLLDGNRQYVIGGMCGSGTGVSFNSGRCIVNRILGREADDDYPPEYFAPSRLLDPQRHAWPKLQTQESVAC